VWLSTDFVRAVPGGTGEAKCSGNYGGTVLAQEQAAARGCDGVVWLDARERRWIEETGTSNLFFVFGARLVTPPLSGTLLPGVTRDSVLRLAADLGYDTREAPVSVQELRAAAASGELTELFSCGTSSMLTPIGRVRGEEGEFVVGGGEPGPVTLLLRDQLMGIQYGRRPDPYGWLHPVG
jgi:branched-chain amino acid aminotransferase